jgi:hypothetical protein
MTTLTINTRNHGPVDFFMQGAYGEARYIYLGNSTLGNQICANGSFGGETLRATPETFERECRKWHKQHLAKINAYGGNYGS